MISSTRIPRLGQINRSQFTQDFLKTGKPVVLTNMTQDWDATQKWSFDYLTEVAGDNIVPVYCRQGQYYRQHETPSTNMLRQETSS